jgi:hypothetical protein
MKPLGTAKKDPLTTLGKILMFISLAITAIVLGGALHGVLHVSGWLAWPVAIVGALAFDLVWLAGLSRLPVALKVGGTLLAVTGGVSLLGLAASVAALHYAGHVGIFAALPGAALFLLAIRPVLDHLTPTRTTVETLAGQKRAEKDRRTLQKAATRLHRAQQSRTADERALTSQKVTDELLDASRHDVAREIAVLRGKAQLVDELKAAREQYLEDARLLDSLMGTGVPGDTKALDATVDGDAGRAHSVLETASPPSPMPGFGFARAFDDAQSDRDTSNPVKAQVAKSVPDAPKLPSALAEHNARKAAERHARVAEIRRDRLTAKEAAARYGVDVRTVRRWLDAEQD